MFLFQSESMSVGAPAERSGYALELEKVLLKRSAQTWVSETESLHLQIDISSRPSDSDSRAMDGTG